MTLAEVLPELKRWSPQDRLELIRAAEATFDEDLADELLNKHFKPGSVYESWSPITCEDTGELMKLLERK